MRRGTLLVSVLNTALILAGCITEPIEDEEPQEEEETTSYPPQAVVALVDTGINPYHEAFRDDSELGRTHPSKYLPGYPEDARPLNLTLDAKSLEDALAEDEELWAEVAPETLYWIPGTKIVAAYSTTEQGIFDTGHGTMVASRAAGNTYSLCGECRIASVQGFTKASVSWAGGQSWIDAQSNSWSPLGGLQQLEGPVWEQGLSEAFEAAASHHLVFASGGNGLTGQLGVVGQPTFTRSTSGPTGVLAVGGHDNGNVILWSGSSPHLVTDSCRNWAVIGASLDEWDTVGGGTSSASPYAAGAAARIVLEARKLLQDTGETGIAEGVLARGTPVNGTDANGTEGPLSDGELTLVETKELLQRTADPRPVETEDDGDTCEDNPPYNTYPVTWEEVPQDLPEYYWIGWGGISVHSLERALAVLDGQESLPERGERQEQHDLFQGLRDAYNGLPV